jgi:LDH2 family malate/lactate/ureidoglycolate dehydrogenase
MQEALSRPPKNVMNRTATLSAESLAETASRLFVAAGLRPAAARTVAGALVDADLRGIPSHGTMLVPMYIDRIKAGSVTTHERAEVISDAGIAAVLDARGALGVLTGDQAMALATDKALALGAGIVTVRHAFHFGAAFRFAQAAARRGCIGIAAANTRPLMPAPGGAQAVVGNNPIAIAVPRAEGHEPIVLDMALSEAALGKIRLAASEGRDIPLTWATDAEGRPTADPAAAIAGLLLPAAGPKGYGLAFMIDVLTGVLSGGAFGAGVRGLYADPAQPNDCAHLFMAIDPGHFGSPTAFRDRVERLADEVVTSRRAPGVQRLMLPGQLEAERHEAAGAAGLTLDPSVLEGLERTAADLGVELALEEASA